MEISDPNPLIFVFAILFFSFGIFSLINKWWIVGISCILISVVITIYRIIYDEIK